MKNIVYFTGAGFSAPLGIPIMSNFLEKSKDLYQEDKHKYSHFLEIFTLIDDLSKTKLHLNLDLANIEDIFSLLEMKHFIQNEKKTLDLYKKYITDTILAYTPKPELKKELRLVSNWNDSWIYYNNDQSQYIKTFADFIKYISGIKLSNQNNQLESNLDKTRKYKYSFITLNYDTFPEETIDFINQHYPNKQNQEYSIKENQLFDYIKLHGTLGENINIPSWNKVGNAPDNTVWEKAYNILKEANEIRILGYSLPESDAYVKFLFGISFKDSFNLQKIDIITLDSDSNTANRYDKIFANSRIVNFKNANLISYIETLFREDISPYQTEESIFETKHKYFMNHMRY
ncbi:hypothetical protein EHQ94_10965 [Leptospira meyeri]|uniref:hypothetical protein n=1 Tax=Leptospira meyeri TaxID=29508 RepID=UPI0010828BBF|nr:hypothetical protein [Leptospira meyeri]TGM60609.1 hypothetical protein EHQ93_17810 [Leptospira meyeri]TGM66465.1 hypothetical protein EHQ94_10965 [Leptospira meyeri]